MTLPMTCDEHTMRLRAGWGGVGPGVKALCPCTSPLSNGVVNERATQMHLRSLGPNRRQRGPLPPLPRSAGRPVPTLANSPKRYQDIKRHCRRCRHHRHHRHQNTVRRVANQQKRAPRLLSSGSTRTAKTGLVLCLGLLHLFMSSGKKPI